ncbi:MAG: porin [Chitinophagaceae bacterium]|nr:porin [Chitinophagaceae bacterium]MCW5904458.1 porin [Chitinophagaceae bacterium]
MNKIIFTIFFFYLCVQNTQAQFLMDMVDTTKETGKGILSVYKRFDHLNFSCYIQPQYQMSSTKGIQTFEGPDFNPEVNNRFLLRRSRVRIEYLHWGKKDNPTVQISFQFDANERGFTVRDVWGRIFENKYKLFSVTTGMFARPFGYETNLSSANRESPERGRMNQLLMKSERDLGAMISFDARKKIKGLNYLKVDVGIFNGQGLTSNGDFDNSKDIIGRVALKPYPISKNIALSAGGSVLLGSLLQNTKYSFHTLTVGGIKTFVVDSTESNKGRNAPRKYFGADAQLKIKNKIGFTELRGEIIVGKHAVLKNSNSTPTALLTGNDGYYIRNFNGAYFYFLQNIFSEKHQLIIKYDWFDPNTKAKGKQIGVPSSTLTAADIKYSTLGLGYINYISNNVKLMLYYAKVWNEKTNLAGYTKDVKDDVFTCRLQFWF